MLNKPVCRKVSEVQVKEALVEEGRAESKRTATLNGLTTQKVQKCQFIAGGGGQGA